MAYNGVRLEGIDETRRWLQMIQDEINSENGEYVGLKDSIVREIAGRTLSGKDVNDRPFKSKKDGSSSNLFADKKRGAFSGHMIDSMRSEIETGHGCQIVITQDEPIYGEVHNVGGMAGRGHGFRMPKREWFGITWQRLSQIFDLHMKRLADKFESTKPK